MKRNKIPEKDNRYNRYDRYGFWEINIIVSSWKGAFSWMKPDKPEIQIAGWNPEREFPEILNDQQVDPDQPAS